MSLAGANPFAALARGPQHSQTQRDQPAPKKNLAKAKDASKVVSREEPKPPAPKPEDPKAHHGNNSAHPGRPERGADRKGRTLPKHPASGRDDLREKRGGKDWGEGKPRVDAGVAEADAAAPTQDGRPPRERRARREDKPELSPEEQAKLLAEREAEARQMTLAEWQAKRGNNSTPEELAEEIKEARRVEADKDLEKGKQHRKGEIQVSEEWAGAKKNNNNNNNRSKKNKKKEVLQLGEAPRKRRDDREGPSGDRSPNAGGGGGKGNGRPRGGGGEQQQQQHHNKAPAANIDLADAVSFPALGGK